MPPCGGSETAVILNNNWNGFAIKTAPCGGASDAHSLTRAIHKSFFPGGALGLIVGCSLEDAYACAELKAAHAGYPWWFNYALLQLPKEYRDRSDRLTGMDLERLGSTYEEMGLRVIWFSKFEEIAARLQEISAVAAAAA